jgi:hypothetical protein
MADTAPAPAAPETAAPPVAEQQTAVTPQSTGETSAPPPSAKPEEGESRESLLKAVQQAVPELRTSQQEEGEADGVSPAPAPKFDATGQQQPPKAEEDLPDEVTAEELARYHPSAKRRVDKLIDQRRELRAEVDRLRPLEPNAKAAESVQKYLRENDIGRDDFLLTLELAAAMRRGDFQAFYQGIRPYMDLAEQYLGIQLPQDLQQQVRQGQMTPQAAALYSRERMDRALAQSQQQRTAQRYDQHAQATAQTQLATAVRDTVNTWEQQIIQSDPDYGAKKAAVQDTMWAVVRERGAPQSPDHAVEIAKEAYRRVNERFRSWTPPKRPTSRTPSSTGRTNGAAPEPKNLKEAVLQAMDRARA